MTICHPCSVSPEWAPGASDPKSQELPLPPVEPQAPLVMESKRKLLRSQALLESKLAGKQVPDLDTGFGSGSGRLSDGPASCLCSSC